MPGLASRRRFLIHGFKFSLLFSVIVVKFQLLPWLMARWSGRLLQRVSGPATAADCTDLVIVATYYGNDVLLASFVEHHRRLGVREFVLLDLSNEGELSNGIVGDSDSAVWRPRGKWDASQVLHWLNFLRQRYATGRWCLSLETSDLFVFYRSETRQIGDLIDFLESECRDHLYALVIEMYGDEPAAMIRLEPGEDPLRKLPFFDPYGYSTGPDPGLYRNVIVRGGVQRRALFAIEPSRSPALNRIPLAKWAKFSAYVADTRLLMPPRLNTPHSPWHSSPTACLLRFAQLNGEAILATAAQVEAQKIIEDGGGLSYAGAPELRERLLKQDFSFRYTETRDLVDCGLLNPGQWF
jgi:Glycosyl transferase family 2